MVKDINAYSYDEATLTKLDIFEQYLGAWLPVFIQSEKTKNAMICDFFAGSGQDIEGQPGSPLRILRQIERFRDQILAKDIRLEVILNEKDSSKAVELKSKVDEVFEPIRFDDYNTPHKLGANLV